MPLVLFNPYIGLYQVLPRRSRVDLEAMAMKECSAFPKAPALLELHHPIQLFTFISRTLTGGGLTPMQRCSQCILQPQPTGKDSSVLGQ